MAYDKIVGNIKSKLRKIVTRDNVKANMKTIIKDRKKMAVIIVIGFFLILVTSYLLLHKETYRYGISDLNNYLENKKFPECQMCHASGQQTVVAKNTINLRTSCYVCHREDIGFFIPISKQVHIYHQGDTSILPGYPKEIDYSTRHKDILGSCETCHVYTSDKPPTCTRCHSGDHVNSKKGIDCLSCHGDINNLFKHNDIKLETHNIFGNESCNMCHSPDKIVLELANNGRVSITTSSKLCKQCHSGVYKDWSQGNHFYSMECIYCHNPHSPKNVNQTLVNITKDINAAKSVKKTPPVPTPANIQIGVPSYEKVT